jgi:hypothetical protein
LIHQKTVLELSLKSLLSKLGKLPLTLQRLIILQEKPIPKSNRFWINSTYFDHSKTSVGKTILAKIEKLDYTFQIQSL